MFRVGTNILPEPTRTFSGHANRTEGCHGIYEHAPMLVWTKGRHRSSAAGSPATRSERLQGQVGAPCSARYGAIPCSAVHMASIRDHSCVWASAHDVYVTRTLTTGVTTVIAATSLSLSNSRLRATASHASPTLLRNGIAGVRKRSEHAGSRLPGWRSSLQNERRHESSEHAFRGRGGGNLTV